VTGGLLQLKKLRPSFAIFGIALASTFVSADARAFSKVPTTCTEIGYRQRLHGLETLPSVLGASIAASALLAARGARDPQKPRDLSGQQFGILALGAAFLAHDLTEPKYPCTYEPGSPPAGGSHALADLDPDHARTFRREKRQRQLRNLLFNTAGTGALVAITDRNSYRTKVTLVGAIPILYTAFRLLTFREQDSGSATSASIEPTLYPRENFSFKTSHLSFDPGLVLKWRF
jgi:hypothetical protein